jgi:hypothetical protein
MNDRERSAWETLRAWQEARDKSEPGSKQWAELNREFQNAESEYYRVRVLAEPASCGATFRSIFS